jgi:general secretion pathway protein G
MKEVEMKAHNMTMKRRKQQGFTLIELMVVVVILAILAAIAVPKLMDRPDEARLVKAKQDIGAISSALQLYKLDNYRYPNTDQGIEALVTKPTTEPEPKNWKQYLQQVPKDPWGNDYIYLSPGEHGDFDLYTLGADGEDGGEGIDATIGNWNIQ